MKHYRKDHRVQSLMIEINRWLYLGHSSVAATSAYLGIEQAKALDIAKNHRMF